ncbi:unnamed protein product [Caenorhabditis sp. 36 PRJEB53466]|nr:unnamed protein product [Caenorhabditis sp. 36 PRJEB53466]
MKNQSIADKNRLYLEKLELTDKFVTLHGQLRKELELASLCVSKAKAVHGITLFSVNSFDSHELEPSVRVEIKDGKYQLVKEDDEDKLAEELKKTGISAKKEEKHSGESEDVDSEENKKKSPYSGQFRPFGVLESTAAKDARKTMKNAIQTLLTLASTQQSIVETARELKNC